ncbi:MAG: helix-turn-helix transcriptional regulator [Betaproteobacteria bacterium]|nr:helix-turn-helix transcriptional regulator [Betaproteobacteria bacterium]
MCVMANIKLIHPIDVRDTLRQLGERIVIARKAAGWRQIDLADRAGVSRSTLVEIEKGSPHVTIGNYLAVLWALNILDDVDKIAVLESDSHRLMASQLPKRIRNG